MEAYALVSMVIVGVALAFVTICGVCVALKRVAERLVLTRRGIF